MAANGLEYDLSRQQPVGEAKNTRRFPISLGTTEDGKLFPEIVVELIPAAQSGRTQAALEEECYDIPEAKLRLVKPDEATFFLCVSVLHVPDEVARFIQLYLILRTGIQLPARQRIDREDNTQLYKLSVFYWRMQLHGLDAQMVVRQDADLNLLKLNVGFREVVEKGKI